MIEIRAFGAIDVLSDDGRDFGAIVTQPKRLALLLYLAIARPHGFHRRDNLVALFWPELDASHSRNALSKAIHHLRRALGDDVIVARGDEVMLDLEQLTSDVREFGEATRKGDHQAALDLYRGPLAVGFFVDDAPEFERWLERERDRLRAEVSRAAWTLADEARTARRLNDAAQLARRASSFMPDDEPTLRRLMSFLASIGDRAGAIRSYDAFASWLRRELEAQPAPETQLLNEKIRENGNVVLSEPVSAIASPPSVALPLSEPVPRSMSSRRVAIVAAGLVAVILIAIGLARSTSARPVFDAKRVMVSRFENRTGDPGYDRLGVMAMDWISEDIAGTGLVSVVDPRSHSLARAGLVVSGAYYIVGDRLNFHAQLSSSADRTILRAFAPVSVRLQSPTHAFDSLGRQAVASVAEATDARVAAFSRVARTPPSYVSYLEYVKGIEAFARHDEAESYGHFLRAYDLDTTFVTALLNAGASILNRWSGQDSVIAILRAKRGSLSPFNQLWLDSYLASRRRDWGEVFRTTRELARQAPGSYFPFIHASAAISVNNPRAARDALLSVDPTRGWMRDWFDYWYTRCNAQHMLGDYESELADARIGRRQYPRNFAVISAEVRPLATLGKASDVDALLDAASAMTAHDTWEVASPFAIAASEAAVHQHPAIALSAKQRVVKWYRSLPPERFEREPTQFGPAWMLYLAQAWPELAEHVEYLEKSAPQHPRTIIYRGVVAAHGGDRVRAMIADSLIQRLGKPQPPGKPWLPPDLALYYRSEIAALLGDRDRAVGLLQDAFADGLRYTIYLHASPAWASIRSDPRFIRIMEPRID